MKASLCLHMTSISQIFQGKLTALLALAQTDVTNDHGNGVTIDLQKKLGPDGSSRLASLLLETAPPLLSTLDLRFSDIAETFTALPTYIKLAYVCA